MAESEPRQGQDIGIVSSGLKRSASQIKTLAAVGLQIMHPIVRCKKLTRVGCQSESRAVMRVSGLVLSLVRADQARGRDVPFGGRSNWAAAAKRDRKEARRG